MAEDKEVVHSSGILRIRTPRQVITIKINEKDCLGGAVNSITIAEEMPEVAGMAGHNGNGRIAKH